MTVPGFRPLSRRSDPTWDALHEGVPPWLTNSIAVWVGSQLGNGYGEAEMGSLMTIERALRSPLDWSGGTRSAMATIQTRSRDPKFYIDLIDAILHEMPMPDEAARLDQILVSGGSVWKVVLLDSPAFQHGLERRVDEAVAEAARHVIAESGKAGKHLGLALSLIHI